MKGAGPSTLCLVAALAASAGCSSLLGIDEPSVVDGEAGGAGSSGGDDAGSGHLDAGGSGHDGGGGSGQHADATLVDGNGPGADAPPPVESGGGSDAVVETGVHDAGAADTHVADTYVADTYTAPDVTGSPCTGAILCDDFEEGVIDSTRWPTVNTTLATVTVEQTASAHSGTHALHVQVNDPGSGTADGTIGNETIVFPGTVYIRLWVMVPGGNPSGQVSYYGYVQNESPYYGINVGTQGSNPMMQDYGVPNAFPVSAGTVSLTGWTCMQMTVDSTGTSSGGSTGSITVAMGGTTFNDLTSAGVWTGPLGQVHIGGYVFAGPLAQFDVWVDDVRIDTSPVPCNGP